MKLKLTIKLRNALIAVLSLSAANISFAADATWDALAPPSLGTVLNDNAGGTISITGGVVTLPAAVGDEATLTFAGSGNWTLDSATPATDILSGDANIVKEGTGSLIISSGTKLNITGKLELNEGTVEYGTSDNQANSMNFSEIVINAGTTFQYLSQGSSTAPGGSLTPEAQANHSNTVLTLNGGTFYSSAINPNRWIHFDSLNVVQDSSFTFRWEGSYHFETLTGGANLTIGNQNRQYGAIFFQFDTVENYNGTVDRQVTGGTTITISTVNQEAGYNAIFTNNDIVGNNFSKSGAGSLTIGQALRLTGTTANINEGTVSAASLAGSTSMNVNTGATLRTTGAGLNDYTGALTLEGGVFEITDNAAFTGSITVGNNAGTVTATNGNLDLDGTFVFLDNSGTLILNATNVDVSGATLDLSQLNAGSIYTLINTGSSTVTGHFGIIGVSARSEFVSGWESGNYVFSYLNKVEAATLRATSVSNMTWSTSNGAHTWDTSADDKDFFNTDAVIFGNASSAATGSNNVTIEGNVTPSSITVEGNESWVLTGSGSITGATSLVKNGEGSLTLSTSNSYTGGTSVNAGKLIIDNDNALGTGAATVASGATIAVKGLSHLASLNYSLQNGATLELMADGADRSMGTTFTTIASGTTLGVAQNQGSIILGEGAAVATRSGSGYNISVGAGSTLSDNVKLSVSGGGVTNIKGGGTYEVHSIAMNTSTLNIDSDTTLKVTNAATGDHSSTAGFLLSESGATEINVSGTLDLASGLNNRDGAGVLNIEDGGNLILRKGLIANVRAWGSNTLNVKNGGTLSLFTQTDSTNHNTATNMNLNILSGATIKAMDEITNVYTKMDIATDGNIRFAATKGNTLAYHNTDGISVQSITMVDEGTLSAKSISLTDASSKNLTITGTGDNNMLSISGKNTATRSTNSITAGSLTGLNISNASIVGNGTTEVLELNNTTLTNVSITNARLALTDATLYNSLVTASVDETGLKAFTTTEKTQEQALMVTLTGLENATITGELTLSLGDLGNVFETALANDDMIVFTLAGVEAAEFNTWYHNVTLEFEDASGTLVSHKALGMVTSSGVVQLYIPEPSTATLSLLALAGLLARRRRKAA